MKFQYCPMQDTATEKDLFGLCVTPGLATSIRLRPRPLAEYRAASAEARISSSVPDAAVPSIPAMPKLAVALSSQPLNVNVDSSNSDLRRSTAFNTPSRSLCV